MESDTKSFSTRCWAPTKCQQCSGLRGHDSEQVDKTLCLIFFWGIRALVWPGGYHFMVYDVCHVKNIIDSMKYRDGISILCLREPRHNSTKWLAPNLTAGDGRDFLLDCTVPEFIHPFIVLNSPSIDGTGWRRSTQLTSPLRSCKSLALSRLLMASITIENVCLRAVLTLWGRC